MARVEQLYSAWFDVFYDALLPLTITAHRFCQGTPNLGRSPGNNNTIGISATPGG